MVRIITASWSQPHHSQQSQVRPQYFMFTIMKYSWCTNKVFIIFCDFSHLLWNRRIILYLYKIYNYIKLHIYYYYATKSKQLIINKITNCVHGLLKILILIAMYQLTSVLWKVVAILVNIDGMETSVCSSWFCWDKSLSLLDLLLQSIYANNFYYIIWYFNISFNKHFRIKTHTHTHTHTRCFTHFGYF